jgi:hypothetical protein
MWLVMHSSGDLPCVELLRKDFIICFIKKSNRRSVNGVRDGKKQMTRICSKESSAIRQTAVLAAEACPSMSVIGLFRILLHVLDGLEKKPSRTCSAFHLISPL